MRLPSQIDANLPDGRCMSRCEISEDSDQIATRVAQKLRDAKFSCQIATFVPADTAVLRRDRLVVILAFTLLTALAWGYLLWLSADMAMGGMDMSDFRMISVRHGPHGAGTRAVAGDGVRVRIRHVGRDDGRPDDALGDANGSYVRPCGATYRCAGHAICCDRLVRGWLFPCMARFRAARDPSAMGI